MDGDVTRGGVASWRCESWITRGCNPNSNRNDPVIPKKKGNAMQNQGHGKSEAPFYPFEPKNVDHCWSMIKPCAAPLCLSDWASLCSVGPALVSLEQLATRGQGMDNNQQGWQPIRMGMLRLNYKPKCHLYFIICYSVYILYIHWPWSTCSAMSSATLDLKFTGNAGGFAA